MVINSGGGAPEGVLREGVATKSDVDGEYYG